MERTPSLDAAVEVAALELVHRNDLDEIEATLISSGIAQSDAVKLVLLIPSAFAREYFEPQGIAFPDHFFVGPKGRFTEKPYASEPIYSCARQLAQRWISESRLSLVERVLDWSAEADGIKQAKEQRLTPTQMSAIHYGFDE